MKLIILFLFLTSCVTPYDAFHDCEEVYQIKEGQLFEINDTIQ